MNKTDILFVALLVGLLMYSKKLFAKWGVFVVVGYLLLKYFKPVEHLTPEETVSRLATIDKDIAYLKSVGLTETSDNETMKKLVAERTLLKSSVASSPVTSMPIVAQSAVSPTPTVPPKVEESKPEPWSLCSIESRGVL